MTEPKIANTIVKFCYRYIDNAIQQLSSRVRFRILQMGDALQLIGWFGLAGGAIGLIAKATHDYDLGWKSALLALFTDYNLKEHAAITIIGFLYAIGIGLLGGSAAGAILSAFQQDGNSEFYLILSGLLILGVPILRISVEGYTVIYQTAQDARMYFRLSSHRLTNGEPALQDEPRNVSSQSSETAPHYQRRDSNAEFWTCIRILRDNGHDISNVDQASSFIGANTIIVRSKNGKKIGEFTMNKMGRWILL